MNASPRFTFDTNILFYAADNSAGEKHRRAVQLTQAAISGDCVLTLQALGELINAMLKKRSVPPERVQQIIGAYRRSFSTVPAVAVDLDEAMAAHLEHGIPFWDALLWSTARRAGCTLLLTEDLQDGRVLGGVTLRNPFALSPANFEVLLMEL